MKLKFFQEPLNIRIGNDLDVGFYFDFGDLCDDIIEAHINYSSDCSGDYCAESYSMGSLTWIKEDFYPSDYCSGSKSFTVNKRDLDLLTGDYFTGNETFYIDYLTDEGYFTYLIPFNYAIVGNNWIESGMSQPLEFNLGHQTGSMPYTFNYDFTGLDFASSTVCLYNYGGKKFYWTLCRYNRT